jgi:membrane associated rhomboid family serine protease
MGIYDREYYRDGPSYLDSWISRGKACGESGDLESWTSSGWFTATFELDVGDVLHGQVWRLLTAAFLHDPLSYTHVLFNMLFLWIFGADVEDLYGPREFLALYLTAAVVSNLAYVTTNLQHPEHRALGASGAVMAVTLIFACHYPDRTLYIWLLPVSVWIFVVLMVAKDFFGFLGGSPRDNTAFACHLGGAAFGLAYHYFNWRILSWLPDFSGGRRERRRPSLRLYRDREEGEDEGDGPAPPVAVAAAVPPSEVDEHLEAKLDPLLEKVKQVGLDNLTPHERETLAKISAMLKKRRS